MPGPYKFNLRNHETVEYTASLAVKEYSCHSGLTQLGSTRKVSSSKDITLAPYTVIYKNNLFLLIRSSLPILGCLSSQTLAR